MMGFRITINGDGSVTHHGIDTGKTHVLAMNKESKLITLHTAGHTYASGQTRNYGAASINVHEYEETEYEDTVILKELFGVMEWKPRGNKWTPNQN